MRVLEHLLKVICDPVAFNPNIRVAPTYIYGRIATVSGMPLYPLFKCNAREHNHAK